MTWLFLPKRGVEGYSLPRRFWRCEGWKESAKISVMRDKSLQYETNGFINLLGELNRGGHSEDSKPRTVQNTLD